MAQITVRLSEAQSGIKGGIGIGTGRYNLESALAVAAAAIERRHGSVDMGALREAIATQNIGAPANVQESHRDFEEAQELGISAAVFNSAINTKALIKAAQDKWLDEGGPITAADVEKIDAPIKEAQIRASMTDYNIRTNRDPSQTVAELSPKVTGRLFGIDPDTQISDLTDEQLEDLVKQGLGGQGISDNLFWSARNEQDSRSTTVLSEEEKNGFVEGTDLDTPIEDFNLNKIPGQGDVTSFDIDAPKDDTPYTLFLRQLLGTDTSGWAADAESFNRIADMARDYIRTNPDYGADANTRRAAAADNENVIGVLRNALGDIRTLEGFADLPIGQYMNANPDMFNKLQPSGSDLTGYNLAPTVTTQTPRITPQIPDPSDGLGFLEGVMSPENLSALGVNAESYASQVPFQTAWRQQASATPGSMNPLARSAIAGQSPFAELQYWLSDTQSPRSFLQDYNPWSAGEFETGLDSAMASAAGLDLTKGSFTAEDIEAAKLSQWLAQPENMLSAVQAPTLMRTDPFKRGMIQSAFQRLYDIAASRDPAGGANVDIASLFGGLR
jgi:hypothetical protein